MNASQFKKLLILLLLVAGIGFFFLYKEKEDWAQSESNLGGKVIPDFPLNDVASLIIKDAEDELTLVKKDEIWTVAERWNYPADFLKVRDLIRDIGDLKVTRNIPADEDQYGRLGLLSPSEGDDSGTLLTFKAEDEKEIATLLLGKEYMRKSQFGSGSEFPEGRYVLPNGKADAIALVSETFSSLDLDAKDWIEKDFIKVERLQSASIKHLMPADSWSISRESEAEEMLMALDENEELYPSLSYRLKTLLSSPSFNDIADPSKSSKETNDESEIDESHNDHSEISESESESSKSENDDSENDDSEIAKSDSEIDEDEIDEDEFSPVFVRLQTFDGFVYDVKIDEGTEDDMHFSFSVSAEISSERERAEDENEEDAKRLDEEFEENRKRLEEKLAKEKGFEKWGYLVSNWTVDILLNKRSDLVKEKEKEEESSENEADVESVIDELVNPLPTPEE